VDLILAYGHYIFICVSFLPPQNEPKATIAASIREAPKQIAGNMAIAVVSLSFRATVFYIYVYVGWTAGRPGNTCSGVSPASASAR